MGGKPEPFQMFWNFVDARRDAGVAVVQAAVEGRGWRVGGLVTPLTITHCPIIVAHPSTPARLLGQQLSILGSN